MKKYSAEQLNMMVNEIYSYSGDLEDFYYYHMDQLDDLLCGLEPTDILRMASSDFNIFKPYFQIDDLGHLKSFDDWQIDDELIEYHDDIVESYIDTFGEDLLIETFGE